MGSKRQLCIAIATVIASACGGNGTPSGPTPPATTAAPSGPSTAASPDAGTQAPPAVSGPCTVGFDELSANGPFSALTSCGLSIAASGASWQALVTYGHPLPFVEFMSAAGVTTTGEVMISGGSFTFTSVDLYSSTTRIPYEITGSAAGTTAFHLQAVQGNTFGGFATIVNTQAGASIDTLRIRLTNPAAACCANPVGLDNIRLVR